MRRSTRLVLAESAAAATFHTADSDAAWTGDSYGSKGRHGSDESLFLPSSLPDPPPPPSSKRRSHLSSRTERRAAVLSQCAAFTDDVVSALRAIANDDADTVQRIVLNERSEHVTTHAQPAAEEENLESEAAADGSYINGHAGPSLFTSSPLSQPHGSRAKRRHSGTALSPPAANSLSYPTAFPLSVPTTKRSRGSSKPIHVLDPARPTSLRQSVDVWIPPSIDEATHADPLGLDIEDPTTLLHYAARHTALRCIRAIVELLGGDVRMEDAQQSMALDEAAAYDTLDAARLLVELGCDPHHLNNNNTTIVHAAAEQGSLTVLRWAVGELGCDVNRRDISDGYSPLMYALDSKANEAGRPAVIQLLIQHGADVNLRDKDGNSALMWAVSLGMDNVAKLLVRHNADLTLANNDGTTPYTLHDWDGQDYRVTENGDNATLARINEEVKKDKERKRREREERLAAKLRQTQAENEQRQRRELNGATGSGMERDGVETKAELSAADVEMTRADGGGEEKESEQTKVEPMIGQEVNGRAHSSTVHAESESSEPSLLMNGTSEPAVEANVSDDTQPTSTTATDTVARNIVGNSLSAEYEQPDIHNGPTSAANSSPPSNRRRPRRKKSVVYTKKRRVQSEAEKRILSAPIPAEEQRESNGGRCKRYIFQEMLNRAVEEGDYGNIERVTRLLNEWHSAKQGKKYRVFPLEYDDSYPIGPMQIAVAFDNDDPSILQLLLDAGIDYYKRTATGFLPIHAAANVGNANSVRLLLQHGCDPNLREESDGYTALMMAADDKDGWKVVQLLLDNEQLELNAQDFHGNTALHWAVFKANVEVVRLLLSKLRVRRDSEPLHAFVANKWGNAPMHYAFYRAWKSEASMQVLEMMLEARISWKTPINKQQLAPVHLMAGKASERGQAIQQLLHKYKVRVEEVVAPSTASVAVNGNEADNEDDTRDQSPSPSTPPSTQSPSSPVTSTGTGTSATADPAAPPGRSRKGKKRRAPPPTLLCPATDNEMQRFKPPNSRVKHADPFLCFKVLYVAADISDGAEPIPIPLVNHIDNTGLPDDFTYIPHCVTESGEQVQRRGRTTGGVGEVKAQCACADGCIDWRRCGCLGFFPLEQQKDLHYLDHFLSGKPFTAVVDAGISSFARAFWRNKGGSSLSTAGTSSAPQPRRTRNSMSAQLNVPSTNGSRTTVLNAAAHTNGLSQHSSLHSATFSETNDISTQAPLVNGSHESAPATTAVDPLTALPNGASHPAQPEQEQVASSEPPTEAATNGSHAPPNPSTASSPSASSPPYAHLPYSPSVLKLHEVNYLCECSDECGCPSSCPNRWTQQGVRVRLQVYKTREKGWACRAMQSIKAGTFVAEYVGELLNEAESARRLLDEYDLNGIHYMFGLKGSSYSIDPVRKGNVARLFNHSCQPNLHKLQVYRAAVKARAGSSVGDSAGGGGGGVEALGVPRMVFVAARDIVKYEELCINYDYEELDHPGGCLICNCGSKKCRHNLV